MLIPITATFAAPNILNGSGVALFLQVGGLYSITDPNSETFYSFKVLSSSNRNSVTVEWLDNGNPSPFSPTDGYQISIFQLGYGDKIVTELYGTWLHRNGYLDIDNIIFDLFFKKICKWDWLNSDGNSPWYAISDSSTTENKVDFFFKYKRPITREEYTERTLGHKDKPQTITHPYIAFYPLGFEELFEEWPNVEEYEQFLPTPVQYNTGNTDIDAQNVFIFQPPVLHEFSYQLTAVADNWKDLRIIESHLYNSVFPRIRGERFIEFPSGYRRLVNIETPVTIPGDDDGKFESTIVYKIRIPLITSNPETSYSILSGVINIGDNPLPDPMAQINTCGGPDDKLPSQVNNI